MQEFLQLQGNMNHFLRIIACISHKSSAAFLTLAENKKKRAVHFEHKQAIPCTYHSTMGMAHLLTPGFALITKLVGIPFPLQLAMLQLS